MSFLVALQFTVTRLELVKILCQLGFFHAFLSSGDIFFKINFFEKKSWYLIVSFPIIWILNGATWNEAFFA